MTMSLEQVRDALKGVWVPTHWGTDGRSYKMSDLIESLDAHLSQPQPVAQGEAAAYVNPEELAALVRDAKKFGKTQYCIDAFAKPSGLNTEPLYATPTIPTGHRVVQVELGDDLRDEDPIEDYWRPLLEWAMGSIDDLNEGPMTSDQWGEDAGLYDQARALLAAAPDAGGV